MVLVEFAKINFGLGIIGWIVVGLIAGWLAHMVMGSGGGGIISDLIVGLIGAFVGGALVRFGLLKLPEGVIAFTSKVPYGEQILISTIGALLVIILARVLGRS